MIKNLKSSIFYFFCRNRTGYSIKNAYHIVFICKGNICRSAFAKYYMETLNLPKIFTIESCGIDVGQRATSPEDAVKIAREFGVDLTKNRATNIFEIDIENADLIILMEYDHYKHLSKNNPGKIQNLYLLRSFLSWPVSLVSDIHDPFGCGEEDFRNCFKTMQNALDALAETLRKSIG